MNPIVLVATLCLAYSVAGRRCLTGSGLVYKLFQDYDQTYRDLVQSSLNRTFFGRDLVMSYEVFPQNGDSGFVFDDTTAFFPSVILSRSPKNKQPIYFKYQKSSSTVEKSGPIKFIRDLYNCTGLQKGFNKKSTGNGGLLGVLPFFAMA